MDCHCIFGALALLATGVARRAKLPRFALGATTWPSYPVRMRILLVLLVAMHATAHADSRDSRDPVHIRAGTLAIEGSRYMKDMIGLAREIDRRTRGSVKLDWVGDGQLGEETAMAERMREGRLDGGGFSETGLVALAPEMAAWGEPGVFYTYEDVDKATAALDASVRERFAKRDMVFVMWADLGFARVFSRAPLSDFGRALEGHDLTKPIDGALTKAIANRSLRTWVLPPLYALAIGGSARYTSNVRYRYVVGGLVLTRAAWSKLTPAEQAIVLEVCRDWEPKIRTSWRKETERGIAALAKAGVVTNAATEEDVAAFVAIAASVRAPAKDAALAKLRKQIADAIQRH